jgi:hypothetical protein
MCGALASVVALSACAPSSSTVPTVAVSSVVPVVVAPSTVTTSRPLSPEHVHCDEVAAAMLLRTGPAPPPPGLDILYWNILSFRPDATAFTVDAVHDQSCLVFTSTYHWSDNHLVLRPEDVLAFSWAGGRDLQPSVTRRCRSVSVPRSVIDEMPVVALYDPAAGKAADGSGFVPLGQMYGAWLVDDRGFVPLDPSTLQCSYDGNTASAQCSDAQVSALHAQVGTTFRVPSELGASMSTVQWSGPDHNALRLGLIDDCMVLLLTTQVGSGSSAAHVLRDAVALPAHPARSIGIRALAGGTAPLVRLTIDGSTTRGWRTIENRLVEVDSASVECAPRFAGE